MKHFILIIVSMLLPGLLYAETISQIPVLEKVTGRVEAFNDDVTHSCKVTGHEFISHQEVAKLIKEARSEKERVLFHHVTPQVPSREYVATLYNENAQVITKIRLLTDHKKGFGRDGEASKELVKIINDQCG